MRRDNSEGIRRHELLWALGQRRIVREFVRIDACMLCRRPGVNASGLCDYCVPLLNDEELRLHERWNSGVGP